MRMAVLLLLLGLNVFAGEGPFAFDTTPGQLPKTVVPIHYVLRLEPDLKALIDRGSEQLDIRVLKPVRSIVLNALDLNITKAALVVSNRELSLRSTLDAHTQLLTLELPQGSTPLRPGEYQLRLEFTGRIGQQDQGLFYAEYHTASGAKRLLCTQMEPSDARRMFPCWDEPVFRATYDLSCVLPESGSAVSNMPIERETPLGDGRKEVAFFRTPSMASYLVALIAGELQAIEGESEGVRLRVLATDGKQEEGRYALEAASKLLSYYADYFQIKYPLPKLDFIAIPGGFDGAMENWGAITFQESELLFDPASSSQATRQNIFVTVAHEMAHQWFGNLVTMAWWNDLWLNEGFATWMETKATDHFNPAWQMWLEADAQKNAVMSRDARSGTHAIELPVRSVSAANDAFDSITYEKGAALIHMLESYLGEEDFRRGIHAYLSAHRYSNTTTSDLWEALGTASGKAIRNMCAGWTKQPGLPVVEVRALTAAGTQTLRFTQHRFTVEGQSAPNLHWVIPLSFLEFSEHERGPASTFLLEAGSAWGGSLPEGDAVKVNAGDTGYYRVEYEPRLFERLLRDYASLPDADRLNLVDDAWAMVNAARLSATNYLQMLAAISNDKTGAVWQQVISTLEFIHDLQDDRAETAFDALARTVLRPQLARLGWDPKPGEPISDTNLRPALITALGVFGDASVIERAIAIFEHPESAPEGKDPNLRPALFRIAGRYASRKNYNQIHELALRARGTEERQLCYQAMAAAKDTNLAEATLELSLSTELLPQEAAELVPNVAHLGEHPELAWDFFRRHARALLARVDAFDRDNYPPSIADAFSQLQKAKELELWTGEQMPKDALPKAKEAAAEIKFKAIWRQRELPSVDQWARRN